MDLKELRDKAKENVNFAIELYDIFRETGNAYFGTLYAIEEYTDSQTLAREMDKKEDEVQDALDNTSVEDIDGQYNKICQWTKAREEWEQRFEEDIKRTKERTIG